MADGERTVLHILEEIDFFYGFTREELAMLLTTGEWSRVPAGQHVIRAGETDLYMYVILQGKVEVIANNKVMSVLGEGDTFGEFGLMGGRRTASVVTKEDCFLLSFNALRLNRLPLELQLKVLKQILIAVMCRLQNINRKIFWQLPTYWR